MAADRVNFDRLKANRFLPDRVFVQISRRCNLTCSMCGWQIWKRNKGFMSVDLFKRVIAKMTANDNRFSAQPTSVFPACGLNVLLKSIARPRATAISGRWRRPHSLEALPCKRRFPKAFIRDRDSRTCRKSCKRCTKHLIARVCRMRSRSTASSWMPQRNRSASSLPWLRSLICGRRSRIREVRQNIFRHIPRRPRSQRHEVVVRLLGLAHRPDLRCGK